MSITVEPVLLDHQWKQNGTNFFRLRITLARKTKYIKTNIMVRKEQIGRGGKVKDAGIRYELERLVRTTEETVSQIDTYALAQMTLDDVASFIEDAQKGEFRLDIFGFWEEEASRKSGSSRAGYLSAMNSFKEFIGKDSLDISAITSPLLRQWEQWLRDRHGDGARAVSSYTAALRHIHGIARSKYNREEAGYTPILNPFQFYKPPVQRQAAHRAVDTDIIKEMLKIREDLTGRERIGVDVFLISFALMGMNAPDMYSCPAPKDGIIVYNRQKTRDRRTDRAEMRVLIDPLVMRLVSEYASGSGGRAFRFSDMYTSYQILGENVNEGLKQFCRRKGYDPFTLYSARHAWASTAYKAKVDKGVINDCLCHIDRDMKVTDLYIDKDWSVMWSANRKVIEQFDWPQ